jgi:hypothetical protein
MVFTHIDATGLKLRVFSLSGTRIDRRSVFGLWWPPDTPAYDMMQGTGRLPATCPQCLSPPASPEQARLHRGHCGQVAGRYFA